MKIKRIVCCLMLTVLVISMLPINSYAYEANVKEDKLAANMPDALYNVLQGKWDKIGGLHDGGTNDYLIIEGTNVSYYYREYTTEPIYTLYNCTVSLVSEDYDSNGHYYFVSIKGDGRDSTYRLYDYDLACLQCWWYSNGSYHYSGSDSFVKDESYNPTPPQPSVSGIRIADCPNEVSVGSSMLLTAYLLPENTLTHGVSWSSSNPDVATIDYMGNINFVSTGKTTITATYNGTYQDTCEINVVEDEIVVDEMYITASSVNLNVGDEYVIKAYFPADDSYRIADYVQPYNRTSDYELESITRGNKYSEYVFRIIAFKAGVDTLYVESLIAKDIRKCVVTVTDQGGTDVDAVATMYRLYNPNSGEHFYTSNAGERDYLDAVGWNYEGEAWKAPKKGDPVYRLYNPNNGGHHYTMNVGERDYLDAIGWNFEGIAWYSAPSNGTAIYRLYNPVSGEHHYTKDSNERDVLSVSGWNYEGVAWYGVY